jgi:uncharacterized protein (DUF433 family)
MRITEVNAIDTEVHLHLFAAVPATPAEALSRSGLSDTGLLGKVRRGKTQLIDATASFRHLRSRPKCYTDKNRNDCPAQEAPMSETHRITVDPGQCGGRPCLRGLRIRVKDVLDLLAAGASREEILADYPLLEAGDITASLEYAARLSDHPVLRVA